MSFQDSAEAPATDQSPEESAVDAPVVDGGTSEETGFETPFNINDVAPEYREDVERYVKQVQGAYTSKTQSLAEQRKQYEADLEYVNGLRSNPETQLATFRELAALHGYELDDGDEVEEDVQDAPVYEDPRLTELLAQLDAEQAKEQEAAFIQGVAESIAAGVAEVEKEFGRELDEEERGIVELYAIAHAEEGQPGVSKAVERLKRLESNLQTRWIDSKKSPQTYSGVPGSEKLDFNDEEARRDRMAAIVAAHQQGTSNT